VGRVSRARFRLASRPNTLADLEMSIDWLSGLLLTALIFVPLERVLALHREQKVFRRGWLNDVIYLLLNAQLTMLGLGLLVVAIIVIAGWLMPMSMRAAVATQPYWAQVIEMIVLSDIGFYFAHRAFHAFPWLWKFHSIHHSIEELDWLAAARVHPVDQIVTKGCALLPVFALGFSDVAIGVYMLIYGWQSVLIHSNVRVNFGPLRWLLASPEFHHWHHSNDREARNKNFAGQVPVLDYLFGTLHLPRGRRPTKYGLDQPIPQTYAAQLLYPFRRASASRPERRS
jgi:sterol desaturase/sphingolipid hydroxylase (fatty acid hydroxylase superfamily)